MKNNATQPSFRRETMSFPRAKQWGAASRSNSGRTVTKTSEISSSGKARARLPEGDAVGDLEALPVLVGVEVGAHEQRVGRAERQRERQHPPVRTQHRPRLDPSRLLRRRGRTGVAMRRAGSARSSPVAHHQGPGRRPEGEPQRGRGADLQMGPKLWARHGRWAQ